MVTEDYASFETAKLLKEKGFKGEGGHFYENNKIVSYVNYWNRITPKQRYEAIEAPTLQVVMKWLRIEHELHVEPHLVKTKHSYGYLSNFVDIKRLEQKFPFKEFDFVNADKYVSSTYSQACEVAIKYILENLI